MPKILALAAGGPPGVTANVTVGAIPYLSATNVFSDSPLVRLSAFAVGSPALTDLILSAAAGQQFKLQVGGVTYISLDNQGVQFAFPIKSVAGLGTAGPLGVPTIPRVFQLDGHNEATRTDILFSVGNGIGVAAGGKYRISWAYSCNVAQAGASLDATMQWTGDDGVVRTKTIVTAMGLDNTNNEQDGIVFMRAGHGNITVTSVTTSIGAGFYDAVFIVEQMA